MSVPLLNRPTSRAVRLALLAAAVALGPGAALAQANGGGGGPHPRVVGHAYTETNDPAGNKLIVLDRLSDGTLKQAQTVRTGGLGGRQGHPGCPGACPILDTQGEIASTPDEHLVFAVNAGSDSITSFLQTPFGLIPIDQISSGGDYPNSLTVHGNTLYVLNSNSGTIKGFKFGVLGFMVPIPGSTQSLVGNPPPESMVNARQIGFDNTGRVLVVSVLGGNMIETFKVDAFGRAGPIANSRAPQQPLPFGFAFDPKNRLVMSEVTSLTAFGNVSTYSLNTNTAALSNIDSKPTGAAAPCWVVVTKDGRYTFVVNTGGGAPADISRYRINNNGSLTSLGANTGPNGAEFARTDEDLSRDSRFLYVLNPGIFAGDVSKIDEYKVGSDGSLTLIGATPANLPAGISGLIVH